VNKDTTNLNTALDNYLKSGQQFGDGEKFYLLGFEAALHARNRCKEFDQIASEMTSDLEELQQQYPRVAVEEPFTRGFQQGREYYQRLCDESNPALQLPGEARITGASRRKYLRTDQR
jgi:hypothetical protein